VQRGGKKKGDQDSKEQKGAESKEEKPLAELKPRGGRREVKIPLGPPLRLRWEWWKSGVRTQGKKKKGNRQDGCREVGLLLKGRDDDGKQGGVQGKEHKRGMR